MGIGRLSVFTSKFGNVACVLVKMRVFNPSWKCCNLSIQFSYRFSNRSAKVWNLEVFLERNSVTVFLHWSAFTHIYKTEFNNFFVRKVACVRKACYSNFRGCGTSAP